MARKRRKCGNSAPSGSKPSGVADENIRAIARIDARSARTRTRLQRASDCVAVYAAREEVILGHVVWFAVWILLNCGLMPMRPFDPFPFSLLTTVVSLEAIFLTLFVLASQSRMTHDADQRAHLDLQINLLSEQEMTMVLRMLKEICDHLDLRETTRSPKFAELVRRTDVSEIARHIERNGRGAT